MKYPVLSFAGKGVQCQTERLFKSQRSNCSVSGDIFSWDCLNPRKYWIFYFGRGKKRRHTRSYPQVSSALEPQGLQALLMPTDCRTQEKQPAPIITHGTDCFLWSQRFFHFGRPLQ